MGSTAGWVLLLVAATLVTEEVAGISRQQVARFINDRYAMDNLYKCLMNRGGCTFFTQKIKDNAHNGLHGRCPGCSPSEQHLMTWAIKLARRRYPSQVREVWRKYY